MGMQEWEASNKNKAGWAESTWMQSKNRGQSARIRDRVSRRKEVQVSHDGQKEMKKDWLHPTRTQTFVQLDRRVLRASVSPQSSPSGAASNLSSECADETLRQERLRLPCSWTGPGVFITLPDPLSLLPVPVYSVFLFQCTPVSHFQFPWGHRNNTVHSGSICNYLKLILSCFHSTGSNHLDCCVLL